MTKFDAALNGFADSCKQAYYWKDFYGAAYRTRLDAAFALVKEAYEAACKADDEELGR